ncbi:hypothetical protein J132_06770 [Termitomyces sp. J132]|nr:hypothetical protein J132_06770 [Termitomyces sp. J132]
MTPDEENLLRDIGVLLLGNLAGFTAMTLVYGVFVLLFSISTYKMINRGIKARTTVAMFVMSLLSFLIATVYWSAYLASFATLVRGILVDTDIGPLDNDDMSFDGINRKNLRFTRMQIWTAQLLPMFSNAVLISRIRVLYPKKTWILIAPILLLAGSIGSGFGLLGVISTQEPGITRSALVDVTGVLGPSKLWKNIFLSYLALTLGTNVISSLLISLEVLRIQKDKGNIGATLKISQARVIVIILLESGILFAVCQIINLGLELVKPSPDSSLYFGAIVITSIYTICSVHVNLRHECRPLLTSYQALYPTVSILLITVQRSIPHLFGQIPIEPKKPSNVAVKNTGARSATRGHLSFAPAAATTLGTIHPIDGTTTSVQNPQVVSFLLDNNQHPDKVQTVIEISNDQEKMDEKHTKTAPF